MVGRNLSLESLKHTVTDMAEGSPTSAEDLEDMPLHSILLILSAYLSVGIGIFHFFLSFLQHQDPYLIFHLAIDISFGVGLLISYFRIGDDKHQIRWSVFAVIFYVVLLAFGGIVGILAGIVGIFGGGLALLATFDETWEV